MRNRNNDRHQSSQRAPGRNDVPVYTEQFVQPRESADNHGGFERDSGFTRERGFGHTPGQRWGNGLNANVERHSAPPAPPTGYGTHGSDMGMGAPEESRGPHYGKGPKGYKRSDARILEEVCEAIAEQGYVDASNVEVKLNDGVVTLIGTVGHRQDKKMIEHLADNVRGVHEVRNEIRIPRPEANLSDERIPAGTDGKEKAQS